MPEFDPPSLIWTPERTDPVKWHLIYTGAPHTLCREYGSHIGDVYYEIELVSKWGRCEECLFRAAQDRVDLTAERFKDSEPQPLTHADAQGDVDERLEKFKRYKALAAGEDPPKASSTSDGVQPGEDS